MNLSFRNLKIIMKAVDGFCPPTAFSFGAMVMKISWKFSTIKFEG